MSDSALSKHPAFPLDEARALGNRVPERQMYRPDQADEDDLRAAAADIVAGRGITLTEAELLEWEASTTGDLPESVQARVLDLLACSAPSR